MWVGDHQHPAGAQYARQFDHGVTRVGEVAQRERCDRQVELVIDERQVFDIADPTLLEARMAIVESLAADAAGVVAPLRIGGALVQPIGGWLMTATPLVTGYSIDLARPGTGRMLGRTLARLRGAMALVPTQDLPPVAALSDARPTIDRSGWQLLHGDFNEQNAIDTANGLRVFDFDDCGYGPTEFDAANTLYMVMFDAEVHGRAGRYDAFRPAFLAGDA